MFQEEYRAVFASGDPTVKDIETRLYMLIRAHMDRKTCITGIERKISYRFFIENTEFTPPVGSKEPARRLSRDQVGRLLKSMIKRGWLVPMHDTSKHKESIVYKLPLAESGLIRICEERNMTAIQAPRKQNTPTSPVNTGYDERGAHYDRDTSTATPRYTSLDNYTTLYNAREIQLTNELINISCSVGFESDSEVLTTELEIFLSHQSNRHKTQTYNDWKSDWRSWCARGKQFKRGSNNASNQIINEKDRVSKQLSDPNYAYENF